MSTEPSTPADEQPQDPVGDGPAVRALIDAVLEDRALPDERQRLQRWVIQRPDVADLYLQFVHQWCALVDLVRAPEHPAVMVLDDEPESDEASFLSETMILPALRGVDLAIRDADLGGPDERFTPAPYCPPATPARSHRLWWFAAGAAAAASVAAVVPPAVLLSPGPRKPQLTHQLFPMPATQPTTTVAQDAMPDAGVPVRPRQRAAIVSAVAAAVVEGLPGRVVPGEVVMEGQRLTVTAGAIELRFDDGAVVVVSAPSDLRVVDRGLLALAAGSVSAHVPPAAVGFRVDSPGLSVVDRGTDFGVRTADRGGGSEVSVFKGVVDAAVETPAGSALRAPVRVTAEHAVAHQVGDPAPPQTSSYEPTEFVRDISTVRVPVSLHGTGAGLPDGANDPFWSIPSGPAGQPWEARPAFAVPVNAAQFNANTPEARWVSTDPKLTKVADGLYTFHTTVDLTGYVASSAMVTANFVADSRVTDMRVNGASTTTWNPPVFGRSPLSPPRPWKFPATVWHEGKNEVDVVVSNHRVAQGITTFAALKLSWDATARPLVQR